MLDFPFGVDNIAKICCSEKEEHRSRVDCRGRLKSARAQVLPPYVTTVANHEKEGRIIWQERIEVSKVPTIFRVGVMRLS
jgi:hypothetical protein